MTVTTVNKQPVSKITYIFKTIGVGALISYIGTKWYESVGLIIRSIPTNKISSWTYFHIVISLSHGAVIKVTLIFKPHLKLL